MTLSRTPIYQCNSLLAFTNANNSQVSTIIIKNAPTVRLEKNLHFYYGDFFASNFVFNDSGDFYVIDFDQAGFLPQSFMMFEVVESCWYPGYWIKDILKLPEDNLEAMKNISYCFAIGCQVWNDLPLTGSDARGG